MSHPVDVQKEREASKLRLLDVWSTLAERYTRRLDEDDIVDIRTGKIVIDRGFIRKSHKVNFGAIAAPAAEGAIVDEGTDEEGEDEDEDDTFAEGTDEKGEDGDELDAFAEGTDEEGEDGDELDAFADAIKPAPVTALDLANAEDLRAFLLEERRRKDLCGSDVEVEEDDSSMSDQDQESEDVERERVDLASDDELDNWEVDESSIVYPVLKQEDSDSDIEFVKGPSFTSPQAELKTERETLRDGSRKRKRVSSETSFSNPPCQEQPPTVYEIPDVIEDLDIDNKLVKSKSPRRSQRPRPTPKSSVSGSGSESNSSDSERAYNRKPSRSHRDNSQFSYHYPYPHQSHDSYLPSPRRNQRHHHPPPPPEMFAPPIPDPRAQFIIAQAMHQLSSLVGSPWIPPHDSSFIPHTPSRRHQSRRANPAFDTPYHPHPYPYSYDPNLSLATLPPESPEPISSPEKLSHAPQKSSMARARSRSRGRRVSFKTDRGSDRVDVYSSPSKPRSRREVVKEHTSPSKGKGKVAKAKAETSDSESSPDNPLNSGSERDDRTRKSYLRGRTPGPKTGLPKGIKSGHDSKRRLKGVLEVA